MRQANAPETSPPRKKMPLQVFKAFCERGELGLQRYFKENNLNFDEWEGYVLRERHESRITCIKFFCIEIEESIEIEDNQNPFPSLVLSNCTAANFLFNNAKLQSINIQDDSTISDFLINNSTIERFDVINSKTGKIEIHQSKTGPFEIFNSTSGEFRINYSECFSFYFRENSRIGIFSIFNSSVTRITLRRSKMVELLIGPNEIQRIRVMSESFIGQLRFFVLKHQAPINFVIDQSGFEHLNLANTVFPEFTTLNVSDCKINRISLSNFCNYGSISFSSVSPPAIPEDFQKNVNGWEPLYENWEYKFVVVKNPSTLRLTDSDLGKIQFINCDLRQFQRFEFANTKMLDVFVAGSQMPENKAFCLPNGEQDPLKMAEQKRLAYGQFKKIYEARGDMAGSLRYLAFEMKAYREELRLEKPKSQKEWFDNRNERFILWFNRYSTNYGNNWLRGVGVTLLVTIASFSIYCFMVGYRPQPMGGDWVKFGDLASHSLAYLNPFRDEDSGEFFEMLKKDGLKITWYARLWDYVSRVLIAYFVYQTIQAFRKLGKSSG